MARLWILPLLGLALLTHGQSDPPSASAPWESSSRRTKIDISPPPNDAKDHPNSDAAVADAHDANGDVQEMHPWDPHKAMKDIEVGDFYFKRKNYKAALDRFQEALLYKPNDALATFKVGQCEENLNHPEAARTAYEGYLKILPSGPMAEDAKKGLERLKNSTAKKSE